MMPIPCRVCSHLERPLIDARLCQHIVNVAQIARDYGVPWKSVKAHREQHLPSFLRVYGKAIDLPSLGELHAEALRIYMTTLDELGRAQAGTLAHIDDDGTATHKVSHTAIARLLDGARKSVDQLASLAADAADAIERPTGLADGVLSARIAAQLDRVVAQAGPSIDAPSHSVTSDDVNYPHVLDQVGGDADDLDQRCTPTTPGGQGGGAGVPSPTQMALDAATPFQTSPGLLPHSRQVVHDDQATKQPSPPVDTTVIAVVPNPRYVTEGHGSPSASSEERAQAGYPDVEITVEDITSSREVVAALVEEHRQQHPLLPT